MLLCCTVTRGDKDRLRNFLGSLQRALDTTPELQSKFCLLLTNTGPPLGFANGFKGNFNISIKHVANANKLGPKNLECLPN